MSKALTAVKDGYLHAVQWVDDHPHLTLWIATGLMIGLLVLP